jgi:hypothetical protein
MVDQQSAAAYVSSHLVRLKTRWSKAITIQTERASRPLKRETSYYVGNKARVVIESMKQRDNERKLLKNQQTPE